MIHAVASIIAVVCYLAASAYQGSFLLKRNHPQPPRGRFIALGIVAVAAHGISAFGIIYTQQGIDLGIYRVASLAFWFICLIGLLSNLRRPLETALALLFPLACLSIAISFMPHGPDRYLTISPGVFGHIIFSILAYSVLSLCALQAVVLAIQERELKHRHTRGILNALPPLQTMEQMLFEMLWVGLVLLTLAIVTGAIYVENLFAQHLVHKTVFSLIAWCIFASLLWGHKKLGWRGHTAVRWTLIGFAALFLAYFGTKLVLELILHRV
jgi:ABC-type uncharacterized transport system permease subunit